MKFSLACIGTSGILFLVSLILKKFLELNFVAGIIVYVSVGFLVLACIGVIVSIWRYFFCR